MLKLLLPKIEVTSTPTRSVENVITTKGLQDRNNLLLDGRTVKNKGKLILAVHMPLQHMYFGGFKDLTQVFLELNLSIEVQLHHHS